jgi:hypothetical protein
LIRDIHGAIRCEENKNKRTKEQKKTRTNKYTEFLGKILENKNKQIYGIFGKNLVPKDKELWRCS